MRWANHLYISDVKYFLNTFAHDRVGQSSKYLAVQLFSTGHRDTILRVKHTVISFLECNSNSAVNCNFADVCISYSLIVRL